MKTPMGKKWNNGDLDMNPSRMKRVSVRHEERVDASPARLFPLVGPAAEGLVAAPGAAPREGRVRWHDRIAAPSLLRQRGLAAWVYTTLLDDEGRRLHAFVAIGELVAGKFELEVEDRGRGSLLSLVLTFTALSEQGNLTFDQELAGRMRAALEQIARSAGRAARRTDGTTPASPRVGRASAPTARSARQQVVVRGDPDACFALACPVAELDWIDGWRFDLIYSDSGRNEDNNIFLESMSGLGVLRSPGANTTWYTTLYDPGTRRFHAVLLTRDFMIAKFEAEMDDLGDGQTRMRWMLTYTGLNTRGDMIAAEPGFERRIRGMLSLLARSARGYIETGEMYRMPASRRARVLISVIGAAVGRHLRRLRR